ncbi:hypothetical protein MKW98_012292 [Papaver atlanticum]|uniref:RRM domain-containing protein n=1 Tax=Papaver atlanticum TaxID=357466 RepID=A0AAD4SZ75_9MAGN|nr:hypothetical protein MKW98_012292 [Papaver atlanticum]
MASLEQPLKKQKLCETEDFSVSLLSQEEIVRKKQNKEEIRSLYECYKRIKFCITHKDTRFMPDFEQAYLSLITASRGCTSVQRILAELIPRYALFCPTALEAATRVSINMYNWSLSAIQKEEDYDGVAFHTAKSCIFGLVDICCAASSETPASSVIGGICSVVFLNALTFLINSFEGKNIFEIGGEGIVKVQDNLEFFSKLRQNVADEDESTLDSLFKFRAFSLLRIFFCRPKNILAACFELFKSSGTDADAFRGGSYFLRQVTTQIGAANETRAREKATELACSSTGSIEEGSEGIGINEDRSVSDEKLKSKDPSLTKNCFLGMALDNDPSLSDWIFSNYNKICKSVSSEVASEIADAFEGIFGSFSKLVREVVRKEDSDENSKLSSNNRKCVIPVIANQHEDSVEQSRTGRDSRIHETYEYREQANAVSSQPLKSGNSVVTSEPDIKLMNEYSNYDCQGLKSTTGIEMRDSSDRPYMQNNLVGQDLTSPAKGKPLNIGNEGFEAGNHLCQVDIQRSNSDLGFAPTRSNVSSSAEQYSAVQSSTGHNAWYYDGDPTAMDVFSASAQLWLGSFGPDASESAVRFQLEQFGPIERFLFYPIKDFALVEYRSIIDAIKAREYMRGSSPWGNFLRVKFLDVGLGSRGSINGVAVGACCHVYIGKVSQWTKDEILHELARVGFRIPCMVTDLTSESALLMEFETAEEAAAVMVHLRQYRKESGLYGQMNQDVTGSHMDVRYAPTPIHEEFRNSNPGSMVSNMSVSPHVATVHDSPRMSQLSSLLSSLSSKYNISQSSNSFGGHIPGNCVATGARDEDAFPSNTIWISSSDGNSRYLPDDELMSVCRHAVGSFGSVIRVTRTSVQIGSCWFVELSSIDAAVTALKTLRGCPVSLFQIEFSQPGHHHPTSFFSQSENSGHEVVSSSIQLDNHGTMLQSGHPFQSNWTASGYTDTLDNRMAVEFSHPEHRGVSHANNEQVWVYNKPESGPQQFSGQGMTYPQAPIIMQPPHVPASSFVRSIYPIPSNSWDPHGLNSPLPLAHMSAGTLPSPFLPASVTPLAHISGNSLQHFDQAVGMPTAPPLSSPPPPPPDMPPPSPPPLPVAQPPPSSPPPVQPSFEASIENSTQCLEYRWQGVICKSGVHYCTLYAVTEDLDACKYSNGVNEPAEWPAKLDVTKRTDFQHVKSTFSSTPPHKREVCRLFPVSTSDYKGFQDFVTYLKQRECAGVIKIPAVKSMWARLLFILPYSPETCSLVGMSPHPTECLIALTLPKETNFEWV